MMTSIPLRMNRPFDWRSEVKQAVRDALGTPWVLAVAMVCATVMGLALLGVMGWLVFYNRDATTILTMVSLFLNALLYNRMRRQESAIDATHARIDALKDKA